MKLKIHLIVAAVVAVAIVLFELTLYRMKGLSLYSDNYIWVARIILGVGVFVSAYLYAKANGYGLPFGQYFFSTVRVLALSLLLIIAGRVVLFISVNGMKEHLLNSMEQDMITQRLANDSTERYQLAHMPADAPPPPAGTLDTASKERIIADTKSIRVQGDQYFNRSLIAGTVALLAIPGILAALLFSLLFSRRKTA